MLLSLERTCFLLPLNEVRLDAQHLHSPVQLRLANIVESQHDVHEKLSCHLLPVPCLLGTVHKDCYHIHSGPKLAAAKLPIMQAMFTVEVVGD